MTKNWHYYPFSNKPQKPTLNLMLMFTDVVCCCCGWILCWYRLLLDCSLIKYVVCHLIQEISMNSVCASPEVRDSWWGADSCSRVDNQILRLLYQLSEGLHLRLQLLWTIKFLPDEKKQQIQKTGHNRHSNRTLKPCCFKVTKKSLILDTSYVNQDDVS